MTDSKGLAIDTETNGEDCRDGRGFATGVSLAWRGVGGMNALYLPFRHEAENYELARFRPILQRLLDEKPVIFHNAKFDLVSLTTLGLNTDNTTFFDTMVMSHLVDENRKWKGGYSLDALSKTVLKNEGKHKNERFERCLKAFGWGGIPPKIMAEYAVYDTVRTLELFEHYRPILQAEKLGEVWKTKAEFLRLVMGMEKQGVLLDQDLCKSETNIGEARMAEIVMELGGRVPTKPTDLKALLLGELGLPSLHHPKTGAITFNKDAMEEYDIILTTINNPLARLILEYRGWAKVVSSNYTSYMNLVSPDGRLRCNYNLHGTVTGRLSCSNPNLQQIPRASTKRWSGKLKGAFAAATGYGLLECDYAQLEFRLGTAYADEKSLKKVFNEDRDIFMEMAAKLEMTRQDTKTMVYSIQYGAGVNRIKNVFGISPAEAKGRIENYYTQFPRFREMSRTVARAARNNGKIPLWSGRFRHFDNPEKEDYKAFNSLIQGGSADIVEHTMLRLNAQGYNSNDCRMLLTVHDSVIFEVKNELIEDMKIEIPRCMAAVVPDFGVKFAVEAKIWGA